jgi:hypothetical protein
VQRSPVDRLHSLFAPVRRFRCRSRECRLELTLPKTVSVQRGSLLALGGLVAALAGALVTGSFLYSMFDEPTRAGVIDGYLTVLEYQADKFNDYLVATPTSQFVIDLQSDSALHLDPLSLPKPSEIALGMCGRTPTGECNTSIPTPPALRVGY